MKKVSKPTKKSLNFILNTVTPSIKHTYGISYTNRPGKYGKFGKNLKLGQKELYVSFIKLIHSNFKKSFNYLWT